MKYRWLASLIVGVIAAGVGVGIGSAFGGDDDAPVADPPDTLSETSTSTTATTAAPATTEPEPTVPASTTTTTEVATTTTEPVPPEPPDRADLAVVAANASGISGSAARMVVRLEDLGYAEVFPTDGADVVEFTVVYYQDGFESSAVRMAEDLELFEDFIAPLVDAPAVADLPADVELLVYVGTDRAR